MPQNYLFYVKAKESGKSYRVYAAVADGGQPTFLFYEDNRWFFAPASLFEPCL